MCTRPVAWTRTVDRGWQSRWAEAARAAAATATAFYDRIPSCQRMTALAGVSRTADLLSLFTPTP
jgi:hypothetical protein